MTWLPVLTKLPVTLGVVVAIFNDIDGYLTGPVFLTQLSNLISGFIMSILSIFFSFGGTA